jgi:peptidyl-prolyl cis-trans isomerase D
MLQQMRKAQSWMIKGVLWAVVLAFVVTIFYSWGVQSSSGPTRSEVATVFGESIGVQEFQRVQNALYQNYRNLFRNQPNIDLREHMNFREMALEHIVRRRLLLRIAQNNNMVVTDAELSARIAAIPAFQNQGRFDPALYQTVLGSQVPPIPIRRFEEEQRQELLLAKVHDLIRASVQVTEAEVQQMYRHERERLTVRYATLVPGLFGAQVQITDEALQAHYDLHKDAYRTPEQRKIRYLVVAPERFRSTADFTQEQIAGYYTAHQEMFRRQEQSRVRHILFKIAPDAAPEQDAEVRAKAARVLAELREGADFVALAQAHSEDEATRDQGGDLGFFPRGQMVKSFEEVAFTLPVGQLSELVRTPFGYHILRVEDRTEADVKALLEVRDEIITKLQEERSREATLAFVDDLMVRLDEAPEQFAALAAQHNLALATTPFVGATGRLAELEAAPNVIRQAFTLAGQAVGTVEGANGTHYIFQVAEVQASTIPAFDVVKQRVETNLRRQRSSELAGQTADEWAAKVQTGTPLAELTTPLQVQVVDTEAFGRNDPVPQLGRSAPFTQVAFGLQAGEAGAAHDGARHFVIQVIERQPADMNTYEAEKATYRARVLSQKQQQTLMAFENSLHTQYQALRERKEIVVNAQYVF